MGVLKVKVNGVWEEVTSAQEPPLDEVWIGAGPPDPVGNYEIWVDNTADPAVLHFKNQIGQWIELDTGNEVTIDYTDPYDADPNSTDELWYDTGKGVPGTLYARTGGQWVSVVPYGGISYEQQYGQEPRVGTLNVAARADHTHGTPPEEVVIHDDDPYTRNPNSQAELWYDTSTDPAVLKVRINDAWEPLTTAGSEVEVNNIDPYLSDPESTAELWFNPSMGNLAARFNNQWLTANADAPNEVTIQGSQPTNPDVELWVDISTTPPVLKAKINQVWKPVTSEGISEVAVSDIDPYVADPNATDEMWYDTLALPVGAPSVRAVEEVWSGPTDPKLDAAAATAELWYDTSQTPPVLRAWNYDIGGWEAVAPPAPPAPPPEIPIGGAGGNPLIKNSATDADVRWGGDLGMTSNGKIFFPNQTGPKIYLYAQTFGLGVESGETSIFASSKIGFRANASNGTEWAFIDANGLGPRTNTNVSWQNGFTGTAQFRVNPAMVTLALWNFTNGVELFSFNPVKIFDYPAGVPAPWMNVTAAIAPQWMGSTAGYIPLRIDCMADGVWIYPNDYIGVGDLWECACTVTWAR